VEVLEDARDKELVQIEAGRGYALLRAEREYQDEMRRAEEEYLVCTLPIFLLGLTVWCF
jgi:Sds3-like